MFPDNSVFRELSQFLFVKVFQRHTEICAVWPLLGTALLGSLALQPQVDH